MLASMPKEITKQKKHMLKFQVFNVEFITIHNIWYRRKTVHCWVCTTNQHWHQRSSMLASMLYVYQRKKEHWHFKSYAKTLTFQVFDSESNHKIEHWHFKSYAKTLTFQVFDSESNHKLIVKKKSVHCWVCIDKPTLTPIVSMLASILYKNKQTNTDINFQVFKTDFIVGFNPTSLYTWKRKVSIVEFALTIQHWHQSLQCWLQCSTKKKTNRHWQQKLQCWLQCSTKKINKTTLTF